MRLERYTGARSHRRLLTTRRIWFILPHPFTYRTSIKDLLGVRGWDYIEVRLSPQPPGASMERRGISEGGLTQYHTSFPSHGVCSIPSPEPWDSCSELYSTAFVWAFINSLHDGCNSLFKQLSACSLTFSQTGLHTAAGDTSKMQFWLHSPASNYIDVFRRRQS